jgi:hypothetical protein
VGAQLWQQPVGVEKVEVFEVVVGADSVLEFLGGFAWVDTFEDAQPTKIFEGELKFS